MTKFILVGGYDSRAADGGKALCEEVVRDIAPPVRVLTCYFAREHEAWEEEFKKEQEFFATHVPAARIEFQLAQPETFLQQLRWAQAVYLHGGETPALIERLHTYPGWEKELEGKTVIGSSAGAYALGRYYVGLDFPGVAEGLGLLPIKLITHWRSDYNAPNIDWDKAEQELKQYKEDLPIVKLREGEFKVFTQ